MSREIILDNFRVNDESDCYVIAEVGHNHQGSLEIAKDMFRAAKECGVNAVKLQKRDNKTLFTRAMYNMVYDNDNSYGPTYGAHREALEFNREQYQELIRYAAEINLTFFATAFDFNSVDFLMDLNIPMIKIASGDLKNIPFLKYVAQTQKPIILSTGGGSLEDTERAYNAMAPINPQLCLLQCTANYPVEPEDMNLRVITTYRERFPDTVIGLSDHQSGIAMAVVAYTLGARVVEKHFTLNRAWRGTDHAFSLEPVGLKKLVRDLRRTRAALGDGIKRPLPCEARPMSKMGKKLVAARDLAAGSVLTRADIALKSPGDGLPPYELDNVINCVLTADLKEDDNITFEVLRNNGSR